MTINLVAVLWEKSNRFAFIGLILNNNEKVK